MLPSLKADHLVEGGNARIKLTFRDPVTKQKVDPGSVTAYWQHTSETVPDDTVATKQSDGIWLAVKSNLLAGKYHVRVVSTAPWDDIREWTFIVDESEIV